MQDDKPIETYQPEGNLGDLSPEQVEVRALGDASVERKAAISVDERDEEQAIEYEERRNLAIDEAENADPEAH